MSGGEKARLVLAMMVWQRPNLLLLDEPTNHLDLATREALSVALNEFEGTLMLVSHDRALLRAVCDEFWLVSRGGVTPFDGDLDDYQRYLLDEAKLARERTREEARETQRQSQAASQIATEIIAKPQASAWTPPVSDPKLQKKLQRELAQAEEKLAALTASKDELTKALYAGATSTSATELKKMGQQLKALEADLATLEEVWLRLGEQLEASQGAAPAP
jgi:ATP-binding cassette subfamily F protein 3